MKTNAGQNNLRKQRMVQSILNSIQGANGNCAIYSASSVSNNVLVGIKKTMKTNGVKVTFANRKVAFVALSQYLGRIVGSDCKSSILIAYGSDLFRAASLGTMSRSISDKIKLQFAVFNGKVVEVKEDLSILGSLKSEKDLSERIMAHIYRPVLVWKALLGILEEKANGNV
jgi:ribosomal protein L10